MTHTLATARPVPGARDPYAFDFIAGNAHARDLTPCSHHVHRRVRYPARRVAMWEIQASRHDPDLPTWITDVRACSSTWLPCRALYPGYMQRTARRMLPSRLYSKRGVRQGVACATAAQTSAGARGRAAFTGGNHVGTGRAVPCATGWQIFDPSGSAVSLRPLTNRTSYCAWLPSRPLARASRGHGYTRSDRLGRSKRRNRGRSLAGYGTARGQGNPLGNFLAHGVPGSVSVHVGHPRGMKMTGSFLVVRRRCHQPGEPGTQWTHGCPLGTQSAVLCHRVPSGRAVGGLYNQPSMLLFRAETAALRATTNSENHAIPANLGGESAKTDFAASGATSVAGRS